MPRAISQGSCPQPLPDEISGGPRPSHSQPASIAHLPSSGPSSHPATSGNPGPAALSQPPRHAGMPSSGPASTAPPGPHRSHPSGLAGSSLPQATGQPARPPGMKPAQPEAPAKRSRVPGQRYHVRKRVALATPANSCEMPLEQLLQLQASDPANLNPCLTQLISDSKRMYEGLMRMRGARQQDACSLSDDLEGLAVELYRNGQGPVVPLPAGSTRRAHNIYSGKLVIRKFLNGDEELGMEEVPGYINSVRTGSFVVVSLISSTLEEVERFGGRVEEVYTQVSTGKHFAMVRKFQDRKQLLKQATKMQQALMAVECLGMSGRVLIPLRRIVGPWDIPYPRFGVIDWYNQCRIVGLTVPWARNIAREGFTERMIRKRSNCDVDAVVIIPQEAFTALFVHSELGEPTRDHAARGVQQVRIPMQKFMAARLDLFIHAEWPEFPSVTSRTSGYLCDLTINTDIKLRFTPRVPDSPSSGLPDGSLRVRFSFTRGNPQQEPHLLMATTLPEPVGLDAVHPGLSIQRPA
ncbi:hypothetical protein WJX84_011147 [Apatococcus fuscideae]|uniref:Uncharacterized protein n=1 Tax=Apatococcus fuscideae TaxID=2026836 RepID=A0AAW1TEQ3_9CHLO